MYRIRNITSLRNPPTSTIPILKPPNIFRKNTSCHGNLPNSASGYNLKHTLPVTSPSGTGP